MIELMSLEFLVSAVKRGTRGCVVVVLAPVARRQPKAMNRSGSFTQAVVGTGGSTAKMVWSLRTAAGWQRLVSPPI